MTAQDHIAPGTRLADEQGQEITVTQHTPDGRYTVDYGSGVQGVLSGGTIRQLYRVLALAAVLAFALCGVAQAAVSHKLLKEAKREFKTQVAAYTARGSGPVYLDGHPIPNLTYACHAASTLQQPLAGATGVITCSTDGWTGQYGVIGGKLVWDGYLEQRSTTSNSTPSDWNAPLARAASVKLSEHAAWNAVIENLNQIADSNNAEMGVAPIDNVAADCYRHVSALKWDCTSYLYYEDAACPEHAIPTTAVMDPAVFDYVSVNWDDNAIRCVR